MTPRCAPPAPMTRRPPWRCAAQIPSCRRTPWSPPPRCSRPVRVERYPATDSANRELESLESRTATADESLTVNASSVLGATTSFVTDASVFVTSGAVNSTLTVIALALRNAVVFFRARQRPPDQLAPQPSPRPPMSSGAANGRIDSAHSCHSRVVRSRGLSTTPPFSYLSARFSVVAGGRVCERGARAPESADSSAAAVPLVRGRGVGGVGHDAHRDACAGFEPEAGTG